METRVSFFLVAGYLVPGVVFGFLILPLLPHMLSQPQMESWKRSVSGISDIEGAWITVLTFTGIGLLALLFSLGVALSELYFKLIKWSRVLPKDHDKKHFVEWRQVDSLSALLDKDWRFREAYVLALTQGADIYGFAGRIRMLGASGLAIAMAGLAYLVPRWWPAALISLAIGASMVLLAGFRTRNFEEWVAAHAAMFLVSGCHLSSDCLGRHRDG